MSRPMSVGAADFKSPNRQRAPALSSNATWRGFCADSFSVPGVAAPARPRALPCLSRRGEQYLALEPVGVAEKHAVRRAEVVDCAVTGALVHQSGTDGVEGVR